MCRDVSRRRLAAAILTPALLLLFGCGRPAPLHVVEAAASPPVRQETAPAEFAVPRDATLPARTATAAIPPAPPADPNTVTLRPGPVSFASSELFVPPLAVVQPPSAVKADARQLAELGQLGREFLETTETADDAETWRAAQRTNDERFSTEFGSEAFVAGQIDRAAPDR